MPVCKARCLQMNCPMKQVCEDGKQGKDFCYAFVELPQKPAVLEAEKLKIAQNQVTQVKKPPK